MVRINWEPISQEKFAVGAIRNYRKSIFVCVTCKQRNYNNRNSLKVGEDFSFNRILTSIYLKIRWVGLDLSKKEGTLIVIGNKINGQGNVNKD